MKRMITVIVTGCLLVAVLFAIVRCNDKISVRKEYNFTLSHWFLQDKIKQGETVQIQFTLHREGRFADAVYYVGYLQAKGKGEVFDSEQRYLVNREYHTLSALPDLHEDGRGNQVFTLYYRSLSNKKSEVRFTVMDNFGQEQTLTVSFDPDTETE